LDKIGWEGNESIKVNIPKWEAGELGGKEKFTVIDRMCSAPFTGRSIDDELDSRTFYGVPVVQARTHKTSRLLKIT
jgi:hypothetical protein